MKSPVLTNAIEVGEGASLDQIAKLEAQLDRCLPAEYKDLLLAVDGFSLSDGVVVYRSDDVQERNETFEVDKYAPGYLAIGDDSGGRSLLIKYEGSGVYLVDQGVMDPDEMQQIAHSLTEWLATGCLL